MPSSQRFSFLSVIVASSAAAGGVLGAFVAVGLLTLPGMHGGNDKVATPSVQAKAATPAETTGSATPSDNVAAAGCDQQTWPHLSQPCMEELQRKSKNVRVITTDRLDQPTVGAIEAPKPAIPAQPATGSKTETTAAVQPVAPSPTPAVTPPNQLPVATSEPWFKPEAPAAQQIQTATPQATPQQAAPQPEAAKAVAAQGENKTKSAHDDVKTKSAQDDVKTKSAQDDVKAKSAQDDVKTKSAPDDVKAKSAQDDVKAKSKSERVAKKAKRRPKESPQFDLDDGGVNTVASGDDDDRPDTRASRSSKQRRHIVERWTEREYRQSDNGGQRPVIVRRGGGGFFENLFGMGRGDDD